MDRQERSPLLIIISAPSGAGKTTLTQGLLRSNPDLVRIVTCTTRAPRPGEVHGKDYYFLSDEQFQEKIKAGEFLEYAIVYGKFYGTLKQEIISKLLKGMDIILSVDVQGVASIQRYAEDDNLLKRALVTIFLTPPTLAELDRRLAIRGTDSLEERQRRLNVAKIELTHWRYFDYLILSSTPEEDLRRAQAILQAEKLRQSRFSNKWFDQILKTDKNQRTNN